MSDEWICEVCMAKLWVNSTDGQSYLMRVSEFPVEDCSFCRWITEEIQ